MNERLLVISALYTCFLTLVITVLTLVILNYARGDKPSSLAQLKVRLSRNGRSEEFIRTTFGLIGLVSVTLLAVAIWFTASFAFHDDSVITLIPLPAGSYELPETDSGAWVQFTVGDDHQLNLLTASGGFTYGGLQSATLVPDCLSNQSPLKTLTPPIANLAILDTTSDEPIGFHQITDEHWGVRFTFVHPPADNLPRCLSLNAKDVTNTAPDIELGLGLGNTKDILQRTRLDAAKSGATDAFPAQIEYNLLAFGASTASIGVSYVNENNAAAFISIKPTDSSWSIDQAIAAARSLSPSDTTCTDMPAAQLMPTWLSPKSQVCTSEALQNALGNIDLSSIGADRSHSGSFRIEIHLSGATVEEIVIAAGAPSQIGPRLFDDFSDGQQPDPTLWLIKGENAVSIDNAQLLFSAPNDPTLRGGANSTVQVQFGGKHATMAAFQIEPLALRAKSSVGSEPDGSATTAMSFDVRTLSTNITVILNWPARAEQLSVSILPCAKQPNLCTITSSTPTASLPFELGAPISVRVMATSTETRIFLSQQTADGVNSLTVSVPKGGNITGLNFGYKSSQSFGLSRFTLNHIYFVYELL